MAITRREALLRRQKHAAANGKNVKSRKECLSFFSCYFETAGVSQTPTLKTTAAVVYTRNGVDALKLRYISGIDRSITDHRPDILGYNLAGCCGWLWFSDSPAASSRCAVISQLSRSICHAVMPPFSLSGTRYGIPGILAHHVWHVSYMPPFLLSSSRRTMYGIPGILLHLSIWHVSYMPPFLLSSSRRLCLFRNPQVRQGI